MKIKISNFQFPIPEANDAGFIVLFTVLLTSIILAMVVGASSIAYKEVVLASAAKESNYAFFAADTGEECALYWDAPARDIFDKGGSITCDGQEFAITPDLTTHVSSFSLGLDSGASCANVTVNKMAQDPNGGSGTLTTIQSLGYNVSCAQVQNHSSIMVERAVGLDYAN